MPFRSVSIIVLLLGLVLAGCSTPQPTWRSKAAALVDDVTRQRASELFPQEYNSLLESFEHGEAVMHVRDDTNSADVYYLLAIQKGGVLKDQIVKYRQRQEDERRQREAEAAARAEEERLMQQAAEAEERLRQQEIQERQAREQQAADEARKKSLETSVPLATSYTVRRGETLPQIAARTEIYNDSSLWPLIYRANRDQIRNPTQLWPGQILKIPRQFSRDEALEAKRYSGKK